MATEPPNNNAPLTLTSHERVLVKELQALRQACRELECENASLRAVLVALEGRGDLGASAREMIAKALGQRV